MPIKDKKPQQRRTANWIFLVISAVLVISTFLPSSFSQAAEKVPYSAFITQVKEHKVASASVGEKQIQYQLEPGGAVYETMPVFDLNLPTLLQENGVEFSAQPASGNAWFGSLLSWVIPPLIFVAVWRFFLMRGQGGGQGGVFSIGKSRAKIYVEDEDTKIKFTDVAGVDEAKTELVEIVDFLQNSKRFTELGARIPKGVLLVGPPGTGKTLLAKAVAGEAGVPFFSISGSEFIEMFVGVGSSRVRDLFEQAKKQAPCIIFIDELDAIGKSRSSGGFYGGNDEREQTLNQLLAEMDGFGVEDSTIIVLAATNRPEILDPALLRPGRFDRQVLVDRPDLKGRDAILNIHAKEVKLADEVDLRAIATRTPGFAGADLANLVNEAALLAARNHREAVEQQDFAEAIERVVAGLEKRSRVLNDKEKEIVAYHEVGHALVGAAMPGTDQVEKISIVPRGMAALGYTLQLPTEDRFLRDEAELKGQIATMLGGRSAEEVIFGSITTGAANDLQRATDVAEQMVTSYGMSQVLGPLAYDRSKQNNFLDNGAAPNARRMVSDETAKAIDAEVKNIVESAHQRALTILRDNRDLLVQISKQLLEEEVMEGDALRAMLSQVQLKDSAESVAQLKEAHIEADKQPVEV
ncbi:MAG: cell division protease FtsH [Phormidesmis priestleyi Ana]|uniref:ATP-dependent zinc metalloprotease FtsH n=1 Tax=Phormidesmis priestleyi Ana TaxID=1666911 RepID=A0A0P7ZN32_9CYAN|nr:MAG: cell division protease FtsH [Phormidesmis priestleyi Ana]